MLKCIINKEMSLQTCQQHSLDGLSEFTYCIVPLGLILFMTERSYMVQDHIYLKVMYIDILNLIFRRRRKF